jgi:hypothetical protein
MIRPGLHQAMGRRQVRWSPPQPGRRDDAASLALPALATVPRTAVRRDLTDTQDHAVGAVLRDLREAVRYLVTTSWLFATLVFASLMILVMMGPLEVLIPFLIKDHLGGGPRDHSYLLAAFGVGAALGSLVMAARPMPRHYLTSMILMWGAACLPFALIATTDHMAVVVASGLVMGALSAAGHLGDPPPAASPLAHARSRRLPRLLRLDRPHAGVDGARRAGLPCHRPAQHLLHRSPRTDRVCDRRDRPARADAR